jgi:hypothetical protein
MKRAAKPLTVLPSRLPNVTLGVEFFCPTLRWRDVHDPENRIMPSCTEIEQDRSAYPSTHNDVNC